MMQCRLRCYVDKSGVDMKQRLKVNEPGDKMETGVQGQLSTGRVVTVLACQLAAAALHDVQRQPRNVRMIMPTGNS